MDVPRVDAWSLHCVAVLVRESAMTNVVNMIAHRTPESRPAPPDAFTVLKTFLSAKKRARKTNTKANRLRQNTCSNGVACST